MTTYVRRGRYLVRGDEPRRDIPGKNGTRVIKVGCDLDAAMYPAEPERLDPTPGLLAELTAQRRARRK